MTVVKGVTEKSPSSIQVLEDSGLPFGFIIQPFASLYETENLSSNSTSKLELDSYAHPKSSLCIKCTHCGSHLNPSAPFLSSTNVLCNFCGQIYSTDWYSQYDTHKQNDKRKKNQSNASENESMFMYKKEYHSRWDNKKGNGIIECMDDLHQQSLPLFTIKDFKSKQLEDIYVLPSNLCPPLLAIFIDGTSTDTNYYKHISSCLSSLIVTNDDHTPDFKGTRIGIFIMTKCGGLSIFDLSKLGGHLKQCWTPKTPLKPNLNYPNQGSTKLSQNNNVSYNVAPLSHFMTPQDVFAPLDSDFSRDCVENALRELADSSIIIDQACQRRSDDTNFDTDGICLGSTLQYFIEFMDEVGYHPGELQLQNLMDLEESKDASNKFCYAGGKIMCFLANRPYEIGSSVALDRCGRIGTGGFGGSCYEIGKRFCQKPDENNMTLQENHGIINGDIEAGSIKQNSPTTKTTFALQEDDKLPITRYNEVDDFYSILGTSLASNAFGLELFAISKQETSQQGEKYFGLPLLRILSDRSGGCGPIIVSYDAETISETLQGEVVARSPWARPLAYGGILRIRLPSSLKIVNGFGTNSFLKSNLKMSKHYERKIRGSISTHSDETDFFMMGNCDDMHTLSYDLEICSKTGRLDDGIFVDGRGEMVLAPSIQTSFVFTSVVKRNDTWVTVRMLRVLTLNLQLTESVESLISSLDPEVLIVVSFFLRFELIAQEGLSQIIDFELRTFTINFIIMGL